MDKKIKMNTDKLLVLVLIFAIICISVSFAFLTVFANKVNTQNAYIADEEDETTAMNIYPDDNINVYSQNPTNTIDNNFNEKYYLDNRNKSLKTASKENVFIGGTPIGIVTKASRLVISEFVEIVTVNGAFSPAMKAGLLKGDLILSVDDIKIDSLFQLNDIVASSMNEISIKVLRNNEELVFKVLPVDDLIQNSKKIGIQVKGELSGVGTLTFIKSNNRYGALGHYICDEYGYSDIYQNGRIFNTTIEGYIKGEEGKAGELKGKIDFNASSIGTIDKNMLTGIYGTIDEEQKLDRKCYEVANRDEITQGKAYIYTTIDGNTPQFYEIEIVKKENQSEILDKSMVIRITDKTLLEKTGGILQGMSGSPIIQNDKIVGAVTHVFISNPALGYGVYVDWMINN